MSVACRRHQYVWFYRVPLCSVVQSSQGFMWYHVQDSRRLVFVGVLCFPWFYSAFSAARLCPCAAAVDGESWRFVERGYCVTVEWLWWLCNCPVPCFYRRKTRWVSTSLRQGYGHALGLILITHSPSCITARTHTHTQTHTAWLSIVYPVPWDWREWAVMLENNSLLVSVCVRLEGW